MDPELYRKHTKGRLEPVLERIKQIAKSDRHLEVSQLIVTKLNDDGIDAKRTAKWMVENLGTDIPLHLVGYHPAYRYTEERTSLETLMDLRDITIKEGLKHVYLGNVYQDDVSNTKCQECNQALVERFGLTINISGINDEGKCDSCNCKTPIRFHKEGLSSPITIENFEAIAINNFEWNSENQALHLVAKEDYTHKITIRVTRYPSNEIEYMELNKGLERLILTKSNLDEEYIEIATNRDITLVYLPVLDRAHFPVFEDDSITKKYLN